MSLDKDAHTPERRRLEELFSKRCDDRLSEAEMIELDALLATSGEARALYKRYMNLHAMLHTYLSGGASEETAAAAASAESRGRRNQRGLRIPPARVTPIRAQPRPRVNPVVLAAAAAVVFGIGLFAVEWAYRNLPGNLGGPGAQFATVTRSIDARWAPGSFIPEEGKPIGRQRLALESGSLRIAFGKGADVTFAGNVDIEILSDNSARLDAGRLLAEVPASASGFTVETDGFEVIDLGTVFGMQKLDSGEVEVSVLSGDVELAVKDRETGARVLIRQLRKWQSVVANPADMSVRKQRFSLLPYQGLRAAEPAVAPVRVED